MPLKDYRQTEHVDWDYAIVFVNGFRKDKNYVLREDDTCTVKSMPSGVTAVSIAVFSLLAATMLVVIEEGWSKSLGVESWLQKGRKAFVNWLRGDLMSASNNSGPASKGQAESSPSISGAKNSSQYGKPYPFVMGKHLYTPMYIGTPYTMIGGVDGEEQYYYALFLLGYNDIVATDFKFGTINLASNKEKVSNGFVTVDGSYNVRDYDPKIELRTEGEVSIYPQKVTQEDLSIELKNFKDDDGVDNVLKLQRFSSSCPMKVQIEFSIAGLVDFSSGKSAPRSVCVAIEYSKDGGKSWVPFGRIGDSAYYTDGSKVVTVNGEQKAVGKVHTRDGDVTYNGVSVLTKEKNKVMRFVAEKTFSYSDVMGNDGCSLTNNVIEIRIVRTNNTCYGQAASSIAESLVLTAIRTWSFDAKKSLSTKTLVPQSPMIEKDRDRTMRVGLRLKANENLSGQLDSFNCILSAKGRIWDKKTRTWSSTLHETQNPASMALLALQSPMRGRYAYPDRKIDLESFGEFFEWCEVTGFYRNNPFQKRFCCNGVLTSQKRTDELLSAILETGRGLLALKGKKYGVFIDRPIAEPSIILNCQNILSASNTKSFSDPTDGTAITFINEDNGFKEDDGIVLCDYTRHSVDDPDMILDDISLPFQTNWNQVWSNIRYKMASLEARRETWTRKVSIEGNLVEMGDLVELQDGTISVGIGEGAEVVSCIMDANGYTKGLNLDGKLYVDDIDKRYGVKIMQSDGISQPTIRTVELEVTEPGAFSTVTFKNPISPLESIIPSEGDIVAFGYYDSITAQAICFGKRREDDGNFTLTLSPYDEAIYLADQTETLPQFDTKVSPPTEPYVGDMEVTKAELDQLKFGMTEYNSQIAEVIGGTHALISNPGKPLSVSAKASVDRITCSCEFNGTGLSNAIKAVEWVFVKPDGTEVVGTSSSGFYEYMFNRSSDGYPEAGELLQWKVRCRLVNIKGTAFSEYEETLVDVGTYGTWLLSAPHVDVRVSDRTVTMIMSQEARSDGKTVFGNIRHGILISKPSSDREWYTPATNSNPYPQEGMETENNYRDGENTDPLTMGEVYTQTLPLSGQDTNNLVDTLYRFKVFAFNEAGQSEPTVVNVTALCTNLRDIVLAKQTAKEIYVPDLSAISANLGEISEGSLEGSDSNYWTLSTKRMPTKNRDYQGAFRVGGKDQYLLVTPIVGDDGKTVIDYAIELRAGQINLSSSGLDFTAGTYIYDDNDPSIRMKLSASGLEYQMKKDSTVGWIQSNLKMAGKMSLSINELDGKKLSSLIITDSERDASLGVSVRGVKAYHFVNDVLDEDGDDDIGLGLDSSLIVGGGYIRGNGDGVYEGEVKFKPATHTVSVHKMGGMRFGINMVDVNGVVSSQQDKLDNAAQFNRQATTAWGLTEEQIAARLFKVKGV